MTAPYTYTDWDALLGANSDIARREREETDRRREAALKELLDALQIRMNPPSNASAQEELMPPGVGVTMGEMRVPDGPSRATPDTTPVVGAYEAEQLRGAARHWGIEGAEVMDPNKLKAEIELRRSGVNRDGSYGVLDALQSAEVLFRAGTQEEMARGMANIFGYVGKIPWAGPTLGTILRTDAVESQIRTFQRSMSQLLEAEMAQVPEEAVGRFQNARAAMNMVGGIVPNVAAWLMLRRPLPVTVGEEIAARQALPFLSTYTTRMLPVARNALRGMLSTDIVERATPGITPEELETMRLWGAALEAAPVAVGDHLLPMLGNFLQKRMAGAQAKLQRDLDPFMHEDPASDPGIVDAEWEIIAGDLPQGQQVPTAFNRGPAGLLPGMGETYVRDLGYDQAATPMGSQVIPPQTRGDTPWARIASDPTFSPEVRSYAQNRANAEAFASRTTQAVKTGQWEDVLLDPLMNPDTKAYAASRMFALGPDRQLGPGQQGAGAESYYRQMNNLSGARVVEDGALPARVIEKQTAILESPIASEILSNPARVTDVDVARALYATNPHGVSVLRSVGDPEVASVMLTQQGVPHRVVRVRPSPRVVETNQPAIREIPGVGSIQTYLADKSQSGAPYLLSGVKKSLHRQGYGTALYLDALNRGPVDYNPAAFSEAATRLRHSLVERGLAEIVDGPRGGSVMRITEQGRRLHQELQARPAQVDVLIGNINDAQAAQYERHGFFEGQLVNTRAQAGAKVQRIREDGKLILQRPGGPPLVVKPENAQPSKYGTPVVDVPELWGGFKDDLLRYANEQAALTGEVPFMDVVDPRLAPVMQVRMLDFMEEQGVPPELRPVLEERFNQQYVDEFRKLAPEESRLQKQAEAFAVAEANLHEGDVDGILSYLRTGEGTVGAGFDKSLFKKLGANMYKGDLGVIAIKEGIQNAVDAIRGMGDGEIRLGFDEKTRTVVIQDTGRGMTPQIMETALMDVGGSFKEAGSSGGYGLAKVALFSRAEDIHVTSVAVGADGKKVATTIIGSGHDWVDGTLRIDSFEVPKKTPTGTTMRIALEEEVAPQAYRMRDFLANVQRYSRVEAKFLTPPHKDLFSTSSPYASNDLDVGGNPPVNLKPDLIADVDLPGASVQIHETVDRARDWGGSQVEVSVVVLNRGLYQFTDSKFIKGRDLPSAVIVDVNPLVDVDDALYPFTTSREELKGGVKTKLDEIFKNLQHMAGINEINDLTNALVKSPEIPGTAFRVLNDHPDFPKELAERVAKAPWVKEVSEMAMGMGDAIETALATRGRVVPSANYAGIGISQAWLGINIRVASIADMAEKIDPALGARFKSASNHIYYNPFASAKEISQRVIHFWDPNNQLSSSIELAESMWDTMLHEVSHQTARGHDEQFAGVITRSISSTRQASDIWINKASEMFQRLLRDQSTDSFDRLYTEVDNAWTVSNTKGTLGKIGIHDAGSGGAAGSQYPLAGDGQVRPEVAPASGGGVLGNGSGLGEGLPARTGGSAPERQRGPVLDRTREPDLPPSLEELAEAKGFRFIARPGVGGSLHDVTTGAAPMEFVSDEAARDFLTTVDRGDGPDLLPSSDVPLELASPPLNSKIGQTGSELGPTFRSRSDKLDALEETASAIEEELAEISPADFSDIIAYQMAGGAGGGSLPPQPPGGGLVRGGGPPRPPVPPGGGYGHDFGEPFREPPWYAVGGQLREPTLAESLRELKERDPRSLARMEQKITGHLSRFIKFMRYRFLDLETEFMKHGVVGAKPWVGFDRVDTGITYAERDAAPWLEKAQGIIDKIPSELLTEKFARWHEIQDTQTRLNMIADYGRKQGWSEKKIGKVLEADREFTDWFHEFFVYLTDDPAYALTAEREIFQYIPHVRSLQATPGTRGKWGEDYLSPQMQFFAEHMRTGNIQMRQMDIRDLTHYLVKSAMWKKHVAPHWDEFVTPWNDPALPQEVEGIKRFVLEWGRVARYGVDPEASVSVRGIQAVARALGVPMTGREAGMLMGMPYRLAYTGMVGGRTAPMFRDTLQIFFTAAKAPVRIIGEVIGELGKNPADGFRAIWQNGLERGYLEQSRPEFELAGLYERPASSSAELIAASPEALARREAIANFAGRIRDLFPRSIKLGTVTDLPVLPYLRQQQLQRGIAGEIGYRTAIRAIQRFRFSGGAMMPGTVDPIGEVHSKWQTLLDDSMASSFEPPILREFEMLMYRGEDEQAARLMARQLADWSNFRGGSRATAEGMRSYGGKAWGFLGSYSFQLLSALKSVSLNGSSKQKTKAALALAAVGGATVYAQEKLGWPFEKWAWWNALLYTGSPALEPAAEAFLGLTAAASQAQGYGPSAVQEAVLRKYENSNMLAGFMGNFNPFKGVMNSVDQHWLASQSTNPVAQNLRTAIIGERGNAIETTRAIEQRWLQNQPQPPSRETHGFPEGSLSPNGGTNLQNLLETGLEALLRYIGTPSPGGSGAMQ